MFRLKNYYRINKEKLWIKCKDEYIKRILAQKSLNEMYLINKVNDELYNDKHSNQESIAKIKKMLNKEDSNNPYKIKKERKKIVVKFR